MPRPIRHRVVLSGAHADKQNPGNASAEGTSFFELIMSADFPEERTLGGRFSWPWRAGVVPPTQSMKTLFCAQLE